MTVKSRKSLSRLLGFWTFFLLLLLKGAFSKPAAALSTLDSCAAQPACRTALGSELAPSVTAPTGAGWGASTLTTTTATGATSTVQAVAPVAVVGDMRLSGIVAYYIWKQSQNEKAQERAKYRYCAAYPKDNVCTPFTGGQSEGVMYEINYGWNLNMSWGTQYRGRQIHVWGPVTAINWQSIPNVDNPSEYRNGIAVACRGYTSPFNRLPPTEPTIISLFIDNYPFTLNDPRITDKGFSIRRYDGQPDTGGNPPPLPWKEWPQEKRNLAVDLLQPADWFEFVKEMPVGGVLLPGDKVEPRPGGVITPGNLDDDPNTPEDERLPKKYPDFTIPFDDFDLDDKPDDIDTDDDDDGWPDASDPQPRNSAVPTASDDDDSLEDESGDLESGTPEHKADRWRRYQENGGTWNYERWSVNYEQNMVRARAANAAVDAYHQEVSWGRREVTVDADGERRRLDIADEAARRGIEYKTGYITRGEEINSEVRRDAILVEQGWEIEWVFQGRASQPLLDDLRNAGIGYKFREP